MYQPWVWKQNEGGRGDFSDKLEHYHWLIDMLKDVHGCLQTQVSKKFFEWDSEWSYLQHLVGLRSHI